MAKCFRSEKQVHYDLFLIFRFVKEYNQLSIREIKWGLFSWKISTFLLLFGIAHTHKITNYQHLQIIRNVQEKIVQKLKLYLMDFIIYGGFLKNCFTNSALMPIEHIFSLLLSISASYLRSIWEGLVKSIFWYVLWVCFAHKL